MILFFLKKNFCDGWDHIFWLLAFNLICIGVGIGVYCGLGLIVDITIMPEWSLVALCLLLIFAGLSVIMSILFSVSDACEKICDFKSVTYKEVFAGMKDSWKDAVLFTLVVSAITLLAYFAIPFYLQIEGLMGVFLASVVFWLLCLFGFSLQWFVALRSKFKGGFRKTFKKCFIIFFDNPGFSIFLFFYNVILLVMSVFLAFLVPGFSGVILAQNNAFRLRLYKYDWMEEHPEIPMKEARKQIPWGELIAEDRETLGPRSLKSFIFPWKD